jgi:thiamine monophosphate kinase
MTEATWFSVARVGDGVAVTDGVGDAGGGAELQPVNAKSRAAEAAQKQVRITST